MNTTNTEVKRGSEEWSALCEIVKMPKEPTTMNTTLEAEETVLGSGAQAHRMLTEAKLPYAGIDRFCVLANDIASLANDEFGGDPIEAARELQSRIGGLENLKSYTDCLLVDNRKFGL